MRLDWQSIIVGLIILGALLYVGRRAHARLRSFLNSKSTSSACETGCGKCEASQTAVAPLKTIVQIERSPATKSSAVKR